MPRNFSTAPGGTSIQNGATIRVKDDGTGWESHKYATTKADVGLGNADNTSDLNKPISTATQTALDGKATIVKQEVEPVDAVEASMEQLGNKINEVIASLIDAGVFE